MDYGNTTRLLYRAYQLLEKYPNRIDHEFPFTPDLSFEEHWVLYDDIRDLLFPVTKEIFTNQPRIRNDIAVLLMKFTNHYNIMSNIDKLSAQTEIEMFTKSCTWLQLPPLPLAKEKVELDKVLHVQLHKEQDEKINEEFDDICKKETYTEVATFTNEENVDDIIDRENVDNNTLNGKGSIPSAETKLEEDSKVKEKEADVPKTKRRIFKRFKMYVSARFCSQK